MVPHLSGYEVLVMVGAESSARVRRAATDVPRGLSPLRRCATLWRWNWKMLGSKRSCGACTPTCCADCRTFSRSVGADMADETGLAEPT